AVCVGLSQDISLEICAKALEKIKVVPGRMDEVENNLGVKIIIDYALTPDSMEKLGALILGLKNQKNKLIWVFGSCGERDRGKRPIMGEIASRYADCIIITNEDPYGEDPQEIIDAVFDGVIKNKKLEENKNCWRIFDRHEAIAKALKLARKGDIILVTGKGAEETMAIGDKRIDWNDKKVILEELEKIKKSFLS
ncbi:MAG TPA: UDP-N-acetylmuramoyl-L-alanyl-D-glutamate--2,6-diaminopimelate ligase, partial [Candidatus Moranbacteria bacterium]|nr:UDP-N-acetylmuramoyl-L-alanyl-D-glutamate--2,6-diaminopimelate ligase [Candidatus Moranbacteria bacterium]